MLPKILYLIVFLMVSCIFDGMCQYNNMLIEEIFNSRENYVSNIPEKHRFHYDILIKIGNQQITDTLNKIISTKSLSNSSFYIIESIPTNEVYDKRGKIWSSDFNISYRWNNLEQKIEIEHDISHFKDTTFVKDVEVWNENITNRSYSYWAGGTGGVFILCSKFISKSEIEHSAFKSYSKDEPLHCIKEQSEDDYQIRLQVNCDWIIDDRREEIVRFLIGYEKGNGRKVFDCEGNEL